MEAAAAAEVPERRPTLLEAAAIAVAISTSLNALGVFTEEAIHWVNLLIGFAFASVARAPGRQARRAAIYLGRRAAGRAGLAAMVVGAVALVADVAAYATDVASRV